MAKRWSKAELAHLKRNASSQSVEELAQRFHTDADTVRDKLAELGLGSSNASSESENAALEDFARALQMLHDKKWSQAVKLFEKVIAQTEGIQLADRARQHLAICRRRTEKADQDANPYLRAVFEKNRGNLDEALKLCRKHGSTDEEHFAYLMASIQALDGAEDEALKHLEAAIRLEPKNRVHAFHDSDFQALRGREEFSQLVQAP